MSLRRGQPGERHRPQLSRLRAAEDLEQVLLDGDADGLERQVVPAGAKGVLDLDSDVVHLEHDEGDDGADGDARPPALASPGCVETRCSRPERKWRRPPTDALVGGRERV
uniref:Uncharacterized protein n=1 Tax=Emiliania huxleyi TaxID=2903 RepID=A0A7S3S4J9_EMIHU